MKRKIISKEDYQTANYQLEMIQREKDKLAYLSETGTYQAHIKLAKTFEELLINLSRANTELDSLIKLTVKKIISELNLENTTHSVLNEELKLLLAESINIDELSYITNKEGRLYINQDFALETSMIEHLNNIINFHNQKTANQQLFDYINSLIKEENKCHKIVAVYQKQNKKKL